jgi:hypothetical protein
LESHPPFGDKYVAFRGKKYDKKEKKGKMSTKKHRRGCKKGKVKLIW